jgi:ABC-type sugar transport system ATPase subunit
MKQASADSMRAERIKEDAQKMFNIAENHLLKTRQQYRDLQIEIENIPRQKALHVKQLQNIDAQISFFRSQLANISIYCTGTSWESMFVWDKVLLLSANEFEIVLKSIKALYESCQKWGESTAGGILGSEEMESIKSQINNNQRVLIDSFLQRLNNELSRLPSLPPAADPEAQNLTLSKRIQLQKEISSYRDFLEKQWQKSPDELLRLFRY